ncbi:MAG: ETC complex I subunit [Alphaproteobacteria bacterium]|nr:ETC complex I subunit [Alphaproteobacteria bacterium]
MPEARIYQPCRTAMQQGRAKTKQWLLEFEQAKPRTIDPVMGWTSSADTRQQLRMYFDTKEEAIAFADRNAIPYRVVEPKARRPRRKSYAENFRFDKIT